MRPGTFRAPAMHGAPQVARPAACMHVCWAAGGSTGREALSEALSAEAHSPHGIQSHRPPRSPPARLEHTRRAAGSSCACVPGLHAHAVQMLHLCRSLAAASHWQRLGSCPAAAAVGPCTGAHRGGPGIYRTRPQPWCPTPRPWQPMIRLCTGQRMGWRGSTERGEAGRFGEALAPNGHTKLSRPRAGRRPRGEEVEMGAGRPLRRTHPRRALPAAWRRQGASCASCRGKQAGRPAAARGGWGSPSCSQPRSDSCSAAPRAPARLPEGGRWGGNSATVVADRLASRDADTGLSRLLPAARLAATCAHAPGNPGRLEPPWKCASESTGPGAASWTAAASGRLPLPPPAAHFHTAAGGWHIY